MMKELDPSQSLLNNNGSAFTVSMLLEESQDLALNLHSQGMKPNDRIVIATPVGIDFVKIMFSAMMLNCQVAIIDPEMGRENYNQKLNQFDPNWVFLDSRLALLQEHPIARYFYLNSNNNRPYFPRRKKIKTICTGSWMPLLQKHLRLNNLTKNKTNKPFTTEMINSMPYLITYTSGTLDVPKGVLHTTDGLGESIKIISNLIKSEEPQTMATHLPHFMLIGGCAGVSTKLWDITWSAEKRYAFILKEKISLLFAPPTEYQELIDYCKSKSIKLPASLSHVILGSAPVHQSFLRRLVDYLPAHTKITCCYGMTENLCVATIDGRKKATMSSLGDPVGIPVKGVEIKISPDDEILIKSNQLFKRYLHLDQRPAWYSSGDLGFIDDDGNLILKGRKKDMIIRKNFNLYPALYIPTIKKIDGVEEAVYVGLYNDQIADEEVHLFIEGKSDLSKESISKKLKFSAYSIDRNALPDFIHFCKIPRKGRQQKIDRQKLMEQLAELSE